MLEHVHSQMAKYETVQTHQDAMFGLYIQKKPSFFHDGAHASARSYEA